MTFLFELDVVDPYRAGDEAVKFIGFLPSHPNQTTL